MNDETKTYTYRVLGADAPLPKGGYIVHYEGKTFATFPDPRPVTMLTLTYNEELDRIEAEISSDE